MTVTIGGHDYVMACQPGEEEAITALAAEFDKTIAALAERIGTVGDRRIAVMAGLAVLDRLRAAEAEAAELRTKVARLTRDREASALAASQEDEGLIARIDAVTDLVERLAQEITASVPRFPHRDD